MFLSISVLFALSALTSSSSFYDNPEQDPINPPSSDRAEELHRKWDFEVLEAFDHSFPQL